MKTEKRADTKARTALIISILFFAVCLLMSFYLTYRTSEYIFDSDASSELVLSHMLSEEGGILSENWYYSTELRVLNTQLIFAPLFRLFSEWRTVRYVGTAVLQLILVLSFFFCARQMKIRLSLCFVGMGLFLLPLSTFYVRMFLIHGYYVPHVAIAFCLLGAFLAVMDEQKTNRVRGLFFIVFILLSFGSGLGGVRQLMVSFIPMLFCTGGLLLFRMLRVQPVLQNQYGQVTWRNLMGEVKNTQDGKGVLLVLCGSIANIMGYVCNAKLLAARYHFDDFSAKMFRPAETLPLAKILGSALRLFGYRDTTRVMSVAGISIMLSLVVAVCCIGISVWFINFSIKRQKGIHFDKYDHSYMLSVAGLMFPASMLTTSMIMLLTATEDLYYLLPAFVFFIPMVCVFAEYAERRGYLLQRVVIFGIILCCLLHAVLINEYLIVKHCSETVNPHSSIRYDGMSGGTVDQVRTLRPVTDVLTENGYTYGYATFWNGNICTEMTNGVLRISPLEIEDGEIAERLWLTAVKASKHRTDHKNFLLLTQEEFSSLRSMLDDAVSRGSIELLVETNEYIAFGFDERVWSPIA